MSTTHPILWAEKLAARVKDLTVELRVNVLACVTRHWLRDDDWFNIHGWWPVGRKPPVVIFSCAGFDLAPAGHETDRAIANVMVTLLTGFYGDVGTHTKGAKDCPLSFDEARDLARLKGPQKFDAKCRVKLKRALKDKLPALEALLRVFN